GQLVPAGHLLDLLLEVLLHPVQSAGGAFQETPEALVRLLVPRDLRLVRDLVEVRAREELLVDLLPRAGDRLLLVALHPLVHVLAEEHLAHFERARLVDAILLLLRLAAEPVDLLLLLLLGRLVLLPPAED